MEKIKFGDIKIFETRKYMTKPFEKPFIGVVVYKDFEKIKIIDKQGREKEFHPIDLIYNPVENLKKEKEHFRMILKKYTELHSIKKQIEIIKREMSM